MSHCVRFTVSSWLHSRCTGTCATGATYPSRAGNPRRRFRGGGPSAVLSLTPLAIPAYYWTHILQLRESLDR